MLEGVDEYSEPMSENIGGTLGIGVDGCPPNLVHILEDFANRFPEQQALFLVTKADRGGTASEESVTYRQLDEWVGRLASSFRLQGIAKGDRVVVMIPISLDLYLVVLALMKLASTAVLIEPSMGMKHMDRCCRLSNPKAFVGIARSHLLRVLSRQFRAIPLQYVTCGLSLPRTRSVRALRERPSAKVRTEYADEDTPALVTFTSGNTGLPKAMSRSHRFLWTQHLSLSTAVALRQGDIDLSPFPLFVLDNLASGVSTVLLEGLGGSDTKASPSSIVRLINRYGVTILRGSPEFYKPIVEYCKARSITLKTLRMVLIGGAPVHPALVESLQRLVPGADVKVVYGSTEAEPISAINAREILTETQQLTATGCGNCVGAPVGDTEIRVITLAKGPIDLEGARLEGIVQGAGVVGEIIVTGKHVSKTYFQDPKAVAENKIADGVGKVWHRTGDTGYLDENGRLWLVGRMSNRILRSGEEIHPLQVEPCIDKFDFVERCALVGVRDAALGQRTVLMVAPKVFLGVSGIAKCKKWKPQIESFCQSHGLPVDEIRFRRSIPLDRHHRGKIDYEKLRAWYDKCLLTRLLP